MTSITLRPGRRVLRQLARRSALQFGCDSALLVEAKSSSSYEASDEPDDRAGEASSPNTLRIAALGALAKLDYDCCFLEE
jgi:hypothetical protein